MRNGLPEGWQADGASWLKWIGRILLKLPSLSSPQELTSTGVLEVLMLDKGWHTDFMLAFLAPRPAPLFSPID